MKMDGLVAGESIVNMRESIDIYSEYTTLYNQPVGEA